MIISVYLPLLATLPMAVIASRLVRAAAPAVAARVLTGLAVLAAFATVGSLLLLVVGGFARHTQGDRVAPLDSVPTVLGVAAGAGLLAATVRLAALLRREHASADRARRVALEHVQDPDQELVVLGGPEQECQAYAVPGGWRDRDRIVVSAALLRGLDAAERRALLAHERAHLRFGHHRLALAAAVAVAVNPLLGRVRDELDYQLERWADEHAAAQTSREVTARSLTCAALLTRACPPGWLGGLAYTHHQVLGRVLALRRRAPSTRWSALCPALLITTATAAALTDATGAAVRLAQLLLR